MTPISIRVSPNTGREPTPRRRCPSGPRPGARHLGMAAADGVLPGRVPVPGTWTRPEETGRSDGGGDHEEADQRDDAELDPGQSEHGGEPTPRRRGSNERCPGARRKD